MHGVFLHAHRGSTVHRERDCFYYMIIQTYNVGLHSKRHPTVHTACLALSNWADDAGVVLRIEKRARQGLPSLMAENGNACTTYAYLGKLFASLFHVIMVSVSALRSAPFKCE